MAILATIQALKDKIIETIKGASEGKETPIKASEHREVLIDTVDTLTDKLAGTTLPNSEQDGELLTNVSGQLDWVVPSELALCEKGGFAMLGDINMQGNEIKSPRITDSHSDGYYNTNIIFFEPDAENDTFVANAPFSYTEDFSDELSDLQIPPKKYVDSKLPVSVLADLSNGSVVLPCPFTDQNGISTQISHIDIVFYDIDGIQIMSYSYLKIKTIERSVGLNPVYTITVEDDQVQAGKVQVLFTSIPSQYYEPSSGGGGGGAPMGGL